MLFLKTKGHCTVRAVLMGYLLLSFAAEVPLLGMSRGIWLSHNEANTLMR